MAAGLLLAVLAAGPARAAEPADIPGTWSGTVTFDADETGSTAFSSNFASRSTQASLSLTQLGYADGSFGHSGAGGQSVQVNDYAYTVTEKADGTRWDDGSPCSWEMNLETSSPVTEGLGVQYFGDDGRLRFYLNEVVEPTVVTGPGESPEDCFAPTVYHEDLLVNRGGLDVCVSGFTGMAEFELPPVPIQVLNGRRVLRGETSRTYPDSACTASVGFDLTFTPAALPPYTPPPPEPCKRGFLAKDWLGFNAGDLITPTTHDASYGLAVRWCTKPNTSTTLEFADVRVVENAGGAWLDAFGRAFESISLELNQEWDPNKSQKAKIQPLPGGGLRVTAATGHFDVCLGVPAFDVAFGLTKGVFKRLPKRVRKRIVQRLEKLAKKTVEKLVKKLGQRTFKRIYNDLKGEINPKTGKLWTRKQRRKYARKVADDYEDRNRRASHDLIEALAGSLIDRAVPKKCLRAWKPKVTATIYPDGTASMIETGSTRGWLWQVMEGDASSGRR